MSPPNSRREDRRPSFQFYPRDWLADSGLTLCSLAARGLWLDLLCRMWLSPERGVLLRQDGTPPRARDIALWARCPIGAVAALLGELSEQDVFSRRDDGAIVSRRMLREAKALREKRAVSQARSEAGRRGGVISGYVRRGEKPPKQTREAKRQAKPKQNRSKQPKQTAKQTELPKGRTSQEIEQGDEGNGEANAKQNEANARARATATASATAVQNDKDKDLMSENDSENDGALRVPYERIKEVWNEHFSDTPIPCFRALSSKRQRKLRSRWAEWTELDDPMHVFNRLCRYMRDDAFHRGGNDRGWTANIDYLIRNDTKWVELLERAEAQGNGDRESREDALRREVEEHFTKGKEHENGA